MAENHKEEQKEAEEELLSGGETPVIEPTKQSAFLLTGDVVFGPFYAPKRISVTKDRDLNRQENFCGGEDVTDLGSKNRELHFAGKLLGNELLAFEALLDNDEPLDLTTPGWGGQIMVSGGEYEGPEGVDPRTGANFFTYSLDVVSTGRDESDGNHHNAAAESNASELSEAQQEAVDAGTYAGL
jgi:hypothetical protein